MVVALVLLSVPTAQRLPGRAHRLDAHGLDLGDVQLRPAPHLKATTRPAEVTFERPDGITEWFRPHRRGFEHGFIVPHRPEGDLVLQTPVTGHRQPLAIDGGVRFQSARSDTLVVLDANGRRVEGTFQWRTEGCESAWPDQLGCLEVTLLASSLRDAAFPVVVDPLVTTPAWTTAPGQADARYGHSVSSAGDVNADGFDDVLIGSYQWSGEAPQEGRAYLYLGGPSGLSTMPAWVADPTNRDAGRFGVSVAGVGDLNGDGFADVVVGAESYSGMLGPEEGRAYVFYGSSAGLPSAASLELSSEQLQSNLGLPVAGVGDVNGDGFADVMLGARYWNGAAPDGSVLANEGRAYLYLGGPMGVAPTPTLRLDPTDQSFASFATSIASAGDVNGDGFGDVIIGSYGFDGEFVDEGRMDLFLGSAAGLVATPQLTSHSLNQDTARYGAVAGAADVNGDDLGDLLIGAGSFDTPDASNRGTVEVLASSDAGRFASLVTEPTGLGGTAFGYATSLVGDFTGDGLAELGIGAFGYDAQQRGEGAVMLYFGRRGGWSTTPFIAEPTDQLFAQFGGSLSTAGDVNGDGFQDLVVGAMLWDEGPQANTGRAYVLHGGHEDPTPTANLTLAPAAGLDGGFGAQVVMPGDVDGDAFGDLLVSTPNGVDVFSGGVDGLGPTLFVAVPNLTFVAATGDTNNDGLADFAVGNGANVAIYEGTAGNVVSRFMLAGAAAAGCDVLATPGREVLIGVPALGELHACSVTTGTCQLVLPVAPGTQLGATVVCLEDTDGDGLEDFAAGAPNGGVVGGEGQVVVVQGLFLSTMMQTWFEPADEANAAFGTSLAAGDFSGDGTLDLVAGAPGGANGRVFRLTIGSPIRASLPLVGSGRFGTSVALADLDRDGRADLLVGAPGMGPTGAVLLYWNMTGGFASTSSWQSSGSSGGRLGTSLAAGADVNGDDLPDFASGAPTSDDGLVELWWGSVAPGRVRRTRQSVAGVNLGFGASTTSAVTLQAVAAAEGGLGGRSSVEFEYRRHGATDGGVRLRSALVPAGQVASVTLPPLAPGAWDWRARVRYPVGTGRGHWFAWSPAPLGPAFIVPGDGGFPPLVDGGIDAGLDGGTDAGLDGGVDASIIDGGVDAGFDDAGHDAGGAMTDGDASLPDAGLLRGDWRVGCDCSASGGLTSVLLALAMTRLRRR